MKPSHAVPLAAAALAIAAAAVPAAAAPPAPLVGTWHLVQIEETDAGGRTVRHTDLTGSLIYTADGRMSVQVSYPDAHVNTDYVHDGYEASFGRFTADVRTHRLVHHVEGANMPALVGRDLPRTWHIRGRRLVIGPVSPAEHWSVTWERQ
ncbi:lipocalin-like domain-containing protein [Sphingomonas morindae]|uniref:Lipocalin-like domain-containing protein n=1 Tax=Sphingomonas morindae TaxID=1541170 RepID=A0ABY4X3Q3_9SPHN|nr:lipocalin-like domain-containing protein [Sphingomonas morindae]USI71518.1 lipocalin-like domain-containing protein [Sphingomonas morindae]